MKTKKSVVVKPVAKKRLIAVPASEYVRFHDFTFAEAALESKTRAGFHYFLGVEDWVNNMPNEYLDNSLRSAREDAATGFDGDSFEIPDVTLLCDGEVLLPILEAERNLRNRVDKNYRSRIARKAKKQSKSIKCDSKA